MKSRDYNKELMDNKERQYFYEFDSHVMHHYMIKSFLPFFKKGKTLELGSHKGQFSNRLLALTNDLTCVEASSEASEEAIRQIGSKATIINSTFENLNLDVKYENIVMTHVLEHLENPIEILKKIKQNWLAESGRFFLVCPNANAPSRQIAVKMGLVTHNSAVTTSEADHGHRITYSLDTLERDARAAGFNITHRSGIFFKALANFQWDQVLKHKIVSQEYLDGCYAIGQVYPDLCSSIFLVCE